MSLIRARWIGALFILCSLLGAGFIALIVQYPNFTKENSFFRRGLNKAILARALAGAGTFDVLPSEIELPIDGQPTRSIVQYSFDAQLQDEMESLFRIYRPDYGAFVAMDANTGRVLSMVSYTSKRKQFPENLALRATFPSASVFKVVTASAVIADRKYTGNTVIPFNGSYHTLYRSNILKNNLNRWTRYMTLKDAFAQSVNTVFAKIGAFSLGADSLRIYADRFGFNREIAADFPVQQGKARIEDTPWALAETASGFTQTNTMSPMQGALIAATIVNDGIMMEPFVVQTVHTMDGTQVYAAEPKISSVVVDPLTAAEVRGLMKETVVRGTSRGSFRGFFKRMADLKVGGKTGSLTGKDPAGKYDWFVGFAEHRGRKLAIAALTIHEKLWRVKSSYLARKAIEEYFHQPVPARTVARAPRAEN